MLDTVSYSGILWPMLIGLVAGLIGALFTSGQKARGEPSRGFIDSVVVGVVGAFLGTYSGYFAGLYQMGQLRSYVAAVIGAIALLAFSHFVRSRS